MKYKKLGNNPSVSVVIPTLNEADTIGNLLSDLSKQTYLPSEIIVVDCGSKDGTIEVIRQCPSATLLTSTRNVSRQRNVGGTAARCDLIFFLDADVRVPKDFIERSVTEMRRRILAIACPHYMAHGSSLLIKALHHGYNLTFWSLQKLVPSGGGSCIITTKDVFLRSGGYREKYTFEDMKFLRDTRRFGKFGFISPTITVSDRRFRNDGILRTAGLYALAGPILFFNLYFLTNLIRYRYGHYAKKK